MDVYAEHADESTSSVVVIPDLGYGGCRLVVAVPESWVDVEHMLDLVDLTHEFREHGRTFRVSTKYPHVVRAYFRKWGIYHYQLIASEGALELHPSLGIADIIVDLTSSGTTLKDNRLRELASGVVLESAACLVGHRESLVQLVAERDRGPLALLLDALDGLRASEGWLHLEVVGTCTEAGNSQVTASAVAGCLCDHGAQHVFRGEVWDADSAAGWRVTALIAGREFVQCERQLFALGASRAVGLPARFVFDRSTEPTFDRLARLVDTDRPPAE
jgi:ATP phosphoribosyltransferase